MSSVHGSCGAVRWSGEYFPTKKSLKDAIASKESLKIRIFTLGEERTVFLNQFDSELSPIQNEAGTFYVAGPDPERDRRWYAEITVDRNGKTSIK